MFIISKAIKQGTASQKVQYHSLVTIWKRNLFDKVRYLIDIIGQGSWVLRTALFGKIFCCCSFL